MDELNNSKINKFEVVDSILFGHNIKELRNRMKLSREDFSELSGISVDYLGKIERGQDIPSLAVCVKIAETLNITIDYLLSDNLDAANNGVAAVKLNTIISRMDENDKEFLVKFLELNNLYQLSKQSRNDE